MSHVCAAAERLSGIPRINRAAPAILANFSIWIIPRHEIRSRASAPAPAPANIGRTTGNSTPEQLLYEVTTDVEIDTENSEHY